ncbi:MAG: hypothetical protein R2758_11760 [Bacteroidales bacterium]
MKTRGLLTVIACLVTAPLLNGQLTEAIFGDIQGRQIGPARMSGRISCIDAEKNNPDVVWVGAANGGIWKSLNRGTTFKPVLKSTHSQLAQSQLTRTTLIPSGQDLEKYGHATAFPSAQESTGQRTGERNGNIWDSRKANG